MAATGYVGMWLKTGDLGVTVQLAIDDPVSGNTALEKGTPQEVIADNLWHLYQWDLENEADWLAFIDRFHVELGCVTAKKWGLSEVLLAVISSHHNPEAGPHRPMVDAIVASDEVVAVMLREPAVSQAMLRAVPGLTPSEAGVLFNAIPGIGPFVSSMDEATPPPAGPPPPSQVAPPPPSVTGVAKTDFPVTLIRANGSVDGRCYRAMRHGLTFILKERLPAGYLLRLQLRPPTTPAFEVHASVEACGNDPDGFEISAKLFALSGTSRDRWAEVVTALGIKDGAAGSVATHA